MNAMHGTEASRGERTALANTIKLGLNPEKEENALYIFLYL